MLDLWNKMTPSDQGALAALLAGLAVPPGTEGAPREATAWMSFRWDK